MNRAVYGQESHDEITNISARVFRREQYPSSAVAPVNLNEYFAKNLDMAKLPQEKNVSRTGSRLRQMLPIALCLFSFASVLSMLVIYIDTTEIRHQQFRLNMTRDYDLQGISQDNPVLVSYLREVHLKKYIDAPLFNPDSMAASEPTTAALNKLPAQMGEFVARDLLGAKRNGVFIQSFIGNSDSFMMAPYLMEQWNWSGLIVEPDPKKYFTYGKDYGQRPNVNVMHACFSPTGYPKEVTLHQEGDSEREEVKISSVLDGEEESDWFESRVKCFPLFTLMLAVNRTEVDLLSLSLHGLELQILKTLPFERVRLNVISLHFNHLEDVRSNYIQTVTRFLTTKAFKLMKVQGHSYFFKSKRVLKKPQLP